jgi:hypothetical protein
MIWFLLWTICGYFAYRAIKGGFERSQSERLNGYGVFAIALAVGIIASWLSGRIF